MNINDILSRNSVWDLGNSWLYKLFETYPGNQKDDEIVAKVWILGRCYAAAVERRKLKDNLTNDEFYKTKVINAIKNINLDKRLSRIKSEINSSKYVLDIHKKLQDELQKISGHNKRSFSSKYLHFHLPNEFYIYDTRAVKGIRLLPNKYKASKKDINSVLKSVNCDKEYARFFYKCQFAKEEISNDLKRKLSVREFDTILLDIVNQKELKSST